MNLLQRYVEFVGHAAGKRCGHYVKVLQIAAELNGRQNIFESLDPRQIASLIWQIFKDVQWFFTTGMDIHGNLPQ